MTETAVERGGATRSEYAITGMTCASCVAHVGRALRKVPGVIEASVNLATERASIDHAPSVAAETLEAAIAKAGYGAHAIVADTPPDDDDARRASELVRKGRLVGLGIALGVPLLVLAMFAPDFPAKAWLMFALALPVYALVGFDFHRGALATARHGTANMDTLVSLGSSAALGYSVYAALASKPTYFETAAVIVTLIALGKYLESRARGKSGDALRSLVALQPRTGRRREAGGRIVETDASLLRVGDLVLVAAGERIPVDGDVVEGRSAVDVAALTGEPIPEDVAPGSVVRAGTLNGNGALAIAVTAVAGETALARIARVVRDAQGSMPPVQRLADRVAGVFVPAIVAIAGATYLGWIATGHPWPRALVVAVAVLVVACPCALGLATPMAIIVGVGVGARRGLLFRDATALEKLAAVTGVVFDKTGTLTLGRPEVVARHTAPGTDERDLVRIAVALERASTHPLALAIVRDGEALAGDASATDVVADPGGGVRGDVGGVAAAIGTQHYLESIGTRELELVARLLSPDASAAIVAFDGIAAGAFEFADTLRPEAPAAIARLLALGVGASIVSGDARGAVGAAAASLGIADWSARATPVEKAEIVRARERANERLAFVGDGINDAPALATASVGLAMGGGAAIALETAGAAILSNDPRAVATAISLARATLRTIRINLFWAFAYNVVLVPLAAVGIVSPIFAAAAMGCSSLFVVANSLFLRRFHDRTVPGEPSAPNPSALNTT